MAAYLGLGRSGRASFCEPALKPAVLHVRVPKAGRSLLRRHGFYCLHVFRSDKWATLPRASLSSLRSCSSHKWLLRTDKHKAGTVWANAQTATQGHVISTSIRKYPTSKARNDLERL